MKKRKTSTSIAKTTLEFNYGTDGMNGFVANDFLKERPRRMFIRHPLERQEADAEPGSQKGLLSVKKRV
jgi:hypothetical protein